MNLAPLGNLQSGQRPRPATEIGERGRLEWISLSELYIDSSYQREILDNGKANIRRMIEEFEWALFGVLIVSQRGAGRYAVIDGQHRATAAKYIGTIQKVPCLVLIGGVEQEARAFAAINGNVTRIHTLQRFRASVAAGDRAAVDLTNFCKRAGVTIAGYPKMVLSRGETMALGSIRTAIHRYSEGVTSTALKFLAAAETEGGLPSAAILGAADLFSKNPEFCGDMKLTATLHEKGGLAALTERAVQRRATYGGTLWINFSAVLKDALRMAKQASVVPMSRLMAGR